MRRLLRNELRRAVAALTAVAGAATAQTWDTTAGKDPDQDVLTAADLGDRRQRHPAEPGGVNGEVAWNKRGLAHRAQNIAGAYAPRRCRRPTSWRRFWGVDEREDQQRAVPADASTTKAKVVPDSVFGFYGEDGGAARGPENLKRF